MESFVKNVVSKGLEGPDGAEESGEGGFVESNAVAEYVDVVKEEELVERIVEAVCPQFAEVVARHTDDDLSSIEYAVTSYGLSLCLRYLTDAIASLRSL